jgi:hypothetical protein
MDYVVEQCSICSRQGMGAPNPGVLVGSTVINSHPSLQPLYVDLGLPVDHSLFVNFDLKASQIQSLRQNPTDLQNEITADAFLNWAVTQTINGASGFTNDPAGQLWQQFMDDNMGKWIRNALVHNLPLEQQTKLFQEQGYFQLDDQPLTDVELATIEDGGGFIRDTQFGQIRGIGTRQGEVYLVFGKVEHQGIQYIATYRNGQIVLRVASETTNNL